MLDSMFEKQSEVMTTLRAAMLAVRGKDGPAGDFLNGAEQEFERVQQGVKRLRADALTTQNMVRLPFPSLISVAVSGLWLTWTLHPAPESPKSQTNGSHS